MRDRDGNTLIKENQNWVGVDFEDPAELAMQHEEAEDGDLDALAVAGMPPDALKIILRFIFAGSPRSKSRWRVALIRAIALGHACNVPEISALSQTEIARQLGCTKALVSHYFVAIADELEQAQPRGGKSRASRAVYSARQAGVTIVRAKRAVEPE